MPNDIVITPGSKLITFQDGSNTQQRLMLTGSNLTFTGTLKAASFSGSLSGSIKNISGTTNYVPKFTSTSNLGNSIIYDDGTNIGIGTSTLYAKLVVSKGSGENVEFNPGNSTWNGTLIESINRTSPTTRPDLNLYTGAASNGSVKIITNNTEKMRVNYDGNVGIGTSSPTTKLDIRDISANQIGFQIVGNTTTGQSFGTRMYAGTNSSDYAFTIFNAGDTANLFIVRGDGNVGIGTTSPSDKFVVKGNMGFSGDQNRYILMPDIFQGTGSIYIQAGYGSAAAGGAVKLYGHNATTYTGGDVEVGLSNKGNFLINSYIGGSRLVTVNINGNVGIGTSSPIAKLHITGSATVPAALFMGNIGVGTTSLIYPVSNRALIEMYGPSDAICALRNSNGNSYIQKYSTDFYLVNNDTGFISIQTNSSERVRINSSGNLGIGTSSPTARLDIEGTGVVYFDINSTDNSSKEIRFQNNGSTVGYVWQTGATMGFGQGSTYNSLFLANGGSVGIGTNSPSAKLDVSGSALIDLFSYSQTGNGLYFRRGFLAGGYNLSILAYDHSSGGASSDGLSINAYDGISICTGANTRQERMRVDYTGNVGIGTTSPAYPLEVNGSLYATRVSGSNMFTTNGKGRFFGTASYALASAGGGGGGSGTVSGTTNYIAKFTSTTAVGNSVIYEKSSNIGIGTTMPSASLHLYRSGSNLNVIKADGGTGTLLEIADSMSGSLMSVNDITGLPIFEVFSNNRVVAGKFNANDFVISGSRVGIGTSSPVSKLEVSGSLTDYTTFNRRTGNYTMSLSDASKLIEMNVATANIVNVPTNTQVAFRVGTKVDIVQYGAGQTTITASRASGVQLRTANGWAKINAQYGVASLVKVGTNEWYMFGNLGG